MPATVKQLKFNGSAEVLSKYAENDTKGRKISTLFDQMQSTIDDLKAVGRFLSVWNAKTGLPETNPPGSAPYEYHYVAGDYFIVGITDDPKDYPEYQTNVSYQVGDQCSYNGDYYICNTATSGTWTSAAWTQHVITNYKPSGTIYTGAASSTVESNPVKANDFYRYDGNGGWVLIASTPRTVTFEEIAGNPSDNTALNSALNRKLDKNSQNDLIMQNPGGNGYRSIYFYNGLSSSYLSYIRGSGGTDNAGTGSYLEIVSPSLKIGRSGTARAILATDSLGSDRTYQFPNKNGTFAMTSDLPTVNNSTITIQKNGTTVDSFTLNQSSNKTINIPVPVEGVINDGNTGYITGDRIYDEIKNHPTFYDYIQIVPYSSGRTFSALLLGADNSGLGMDFDATISSHKQDPDEPYSLQDLDFWASGFITFQKGSNNKLYLDLSNIIGSDKTLTFENKDGEVMLHNTWHDVTLGTGYYDSDSAKLKFEHADANGGQIYSSFETVNNSEVYFVTIDSPKAVKIKANTYDDTSYAYLSTYQLEHNQTFEFPDKSGTFAMTSDIPPITADDYTLEV